MKSAEQKFNEELNKCNNMDQVLNIVSKHYDLSQPFGFATKVIVVTGIKKILDLVKAKPRITIL
jgi:hypothetical protein